MKSLLTATILGSALLSACVTAPGPGTTEGATPPHLSMQGNTKVWDNIGSFGPVPAAKAAMGADTCAKLNSMSANYVATGYHARAVGLDGKTMPEGGFLCTRK